MLRPRLGTNESLTPILQYFPNLEYFNIKLGLSKIRHNPFDGRKGFKYLSN
jgi:hypothetical protein